MVTESQIQKKQIPAQTQKRKKLPLFVTVLTGLSDSGGRRLASKLAHASDAYEPHHTIGDESADEFAWYLCTNASLTYYADADVC